MAPFRIDLHQPLTQVREAVQRLAQSGAAGFQIAKCAGCGNRMVNNVANTVVERVTCGKCGHVTSLEDCGSGFTVILPFKRAKV